MEYRWHILGPGGGGAMYYPTVSPHDNCVVLIGCDMTNSFITTDGGERWTELNFHGNARAFACDPENPDVLYAGSIGLFRTDNSGRDWQLIFPNPDTTTSVFEGDHASEVLVSPGNWPGGKVVGIAAGQGELWVGVNADRLLLFRSPDGKANFSPAGELMKSDLLRLWCAGPDALLAVSGREICLFKHGRKEQIPLPDGRELLDAAIALDRVSDSPVIFAATGSHWEGGRFRSGLYRYIANAGWAELAGGLDQDLEASEARSINHVAACVSDGSAVYASIREPSGDNTRNFGIMKSRDSGASWDWVLRINDVQPARRDTGWVEQDYNTCWAGAPLWMGVSPNNRNLLYATDWGTVYKTTDGGQSWLQLYTNRQPGGGWASRGIDVTNVYELAFDPFDKAHVLLPCTDIGLFASQNGGKSWIHSEAGVPKQWSNTCYCVLFDPDVTGRMWSAWSSCHDLPRQKMLRAGKLGSYHGGVCASDDGGKSWQASNSGMPDNSPVTHLVIDPYSQPGCRTLVSAVFGKGVCKSTDNGKTWMLKNMGIDGPLNAWRLLFAPDGALYLLVAGDTAGGVTTDGALYRSGDCAEHWQRLPLPQGVFFANDIAIDSRNPARLYLACWGNETGFPARRGGLYVSKDDGQNWRLLLDDSLHVYGVTVWPHNPDVLYATAYEGIVFRSGNQGSTWRSLPGYDFKWPKKVQADPCDSGMLYLSTFGSCIWHGPAQGAEKDFGIVRIT